VFINKPRTLGVNHAALNQRQPTTSTMICTTMIHSMMKVSAAMRVSHRWVRHR